MLKYRAMSLMQNYAKAIWMRKHGDDEASKRWEECAERLEAEYGIFAQCSGMANASVLEMSAGCTSTWTTTRSGGANA